jgi:metal-sulfur cluster biosynthetic enzyme
MKQVILDIPDNKLPFFMELINNLGFVKKIEIDDEPTKDQILDNIKAGLKEVQLFKNGKLSTTSAKDFLNEV